MNNFNTDTTVLNIFHHNSDQPGEFLLAPADIKKLNERLLLELFTDPRTVFLWTCPTQPQDISKLANLGFTFLTPEKLDKPVPYTDEDLRGDTEKDEEGDNIWGDMPTLLGRNCALTRFKFFSNLARKDK